MDWKDHDVKPHENGQDDSTVMLPGGMVCLERDVDGKISFPPKIVLTPSGRAALEATRRKA